jgi:uncharacterized membrane protein
LSLSFIFWLDLLGQDIHQPIFARQKRSKWFCLIAAAQIFLGNWCDTWKIIIIIIIKRFGENVTNAASWIINQRHTKNITQHPASGDIVYTRCHPVVWCIWVYTTTTNIKGTKKRIPFLSLSVTIVTILMTLIYRFILSPA